MDIKLKIKIIVGSTRQNRFSEYPAQWVYELVKSREEIDVELIDLRDYPMPFLDDAVSPAYRQGEPENEIVKKWAEKIREADGFIIITPEYNHGYPGVLKNALDNLYGEWNNKPISFVSYGGVGGARSVEQLRLVSIELQMAPIRNTVHIFAPWALRDEGGKLKPGAFDQFKDSVDNMLNQLLWWAKTLKMAR